MALKFLFDLDAKLGAARGVAKVLRGIEKSLLAIDPGLKMTRRVFYALGYAAGTAVRGVVGLARAVGTTLRGAVNAGGSAMKWLGGKIGEVGRDAFSSFLGYASWDGLKALVSGAWNAGKQMVATAADAEKTGRILDRVVGPQKAAMITAATGKIAKATGIDDDHFNEMAMSLLRLGFAFDKLPAAWALAADIAALKKGDPAGTIDEITQALANMQTKGGLNIRGLKAIGVTEEAFYKQLAAQKKITAAAAEARVGKGKISTADQMQALQAVVAKVAGAPGLAAMEEGKGTGAAIDRVSRIPDELSKSLAKTPAMTAITAQLNRMADLFDPESPTGKQISTGMQAMVKGFADALAKIDVEKLSKGLTDLFTKLPGLISATTAAAVKLVEVLGKFGGTKDSAAPVLPPMKAMSPSSFPGLGGAASVGGAPIVARAAQEEFERTGVMPRSIASYATKGVIRQDRVGPKPGFMDWFFGQMSSNAGKSAGAAGVAEADKSGRAIGKALEAGTKAELQVHSPSRKFANIGAMAGRGAQIGGVAEGRRAGAAIGDAIESGARDVPAPSVGATGGGVGRSVTINMPITVTAAAGPDAGQEIVRALRAALPQELQALMERLRLELGLT